MSDVYVVAQKAIYRHAIIGVYLSVKKAIKAAKRAAAKDRDGHHNYEVLPFESGVDVRWRKDDETWDNEDGGWHQPASIFTCVKSGTEGVEVDIIKDYKPS